MLLLHMHPALPLGALVLSRYEPNIQLMTNTNCNGYDGKNVIVISSDRFPDVLLCSFCVSRMKRSCVTASRAL